MTLYRVAAEFCTSGNNTVKVTSEWVPHRDQAEELATELGPIENQRQSFYKYRIESKEVKYESR